MSGRNTVAATLTMREAAIVGDLLDFGGAALIDQDVATEDEIATLRRNVAPATKYGGRAMFRPVRPDPGSQCGRVLETVEAAPDPIVALDIQAVTNTAGGFLSIGQICGALGNLVARGFVCRRRDGTYYATARAGHAPADPEPTAPPAAPGPETPA